MPELPEVEAIRLRILPFVSGRQIARVRTTGESYFFLTSPRKLARVLPGRRFMGIERRGKYLTARLDDASMLLLHLGMTGQLLVSGATRVHPPSAVRASALLPAASTRFEPDRHTHLVIEFVDGGPKVMLRDVRKFGKCAWRAAGELDQRLEKLGVDALEVSGKELHTASRRRSIDIKTLLLDQTVLAGVGNIYADEVLFLAGMRPTRLASRITRRGYERVAAELRILLRRAIEEGGSSISDFVHPDGSDGGFQQQHHVYGREGAGCRSCGVPIQRLVTRGRSMHFCPSCQR